MQNYDVIFMIVAFVVVGYFLLFKTPKQPNEPDGSEEVQNGASPSQPNEPDGPEEVQNGASPSQPNEPDGPEEVQNGAERGRGTQSRYWALRLIAGINVFVGWAIIIFGVLVAMLLGAHDQPVVGGVSLLMILPLVLVGVSFVSLGELIRLAIDVANATRGMASHIRALRDRDVQELREQDVAE